MLAKLGQETFGLAHYPPCVLVCAVSIKDYTCLGVVSARLTTHLCLFPDSHRIPKGHWFIRLRPLLRILAHHESEYKTMAQEEMADEVGTDPVLFFH